MITIHLVLTFSLFTEDVKNILDESLKDLPLGSYIYVTLGEYVSPFTDKEKEQQVRSCYSPSENQMIIFEEPKGTSIDIKVRNSTSSKEDSFDSISKFIKEEILQDVPVEVVALVEHWYQNNSQLIKFFNSM